MTGFQQGLYNVQPKNSSKGSTGRNNSETLPGQSNVPKGYREASIQQFTPEQIDLFKHLFSFLGPDSFLSKLAGGDEGTYSQIEAPALKQFNALQGNIASRFSGMGSGARRSSGFQNTMSSAAQDFASQLQAQRVGLQQGAIKDLGSMASQLLGQRPYEQALVQKSPSFLKQLGVSAAEGLPAAAAAFLL